MHVHTYICIYIYICVYTHKFINLWIHNKPNSRKRIWHRNFHKDRKVIFHYSCVVFPISWSFWRWPSQINCPLVLSCSINIINPYIHSSHHHKPYWTQRQLGGSSHGAPPEVPLTTGPFLPGPFSQHLHVQFALGRRGLLRKPRAAIRPRRSGIPEGCQGVCYGRWRMVKGPDTNQTWRWTFVNLAAWWMTIPSDCCLFLMDWNHQAVNVDPGLLNHDFDQVGYNFLYVFWGVLYPLTSAWSWLVS